MLQYFYLTSIGYYSVHHSVFYELLCNITWHDMQ